MARDQQVKAWLEQKLAGLRKQLSETVIERDQANQRISRLRGEMEALHTLLRSEFGSESTIDEQGSAGYGAQHQFVGMRIREAAAAVLAQAGAPLHVTEILKRMQAGGVTIASQSPVNTVVSTLVRNTGTFHRTDPNTFELLGPPVQFSYYPGKRG
jgi:beta-phosphoglucomutase-like phosphatase (HAD superfamily)